MVLFYWWDIAVIQAVRWLEVDGVKRRVFRHERTGLWAVEAAS